MGIQGTLRRLELLWNGKKFEVEIDLSDSAEVFKLQIYSLTGVPPESQKVLNLVKGSYLKDDTDLSTLDIQDGHRVMLVGQPETQSNNTAPPVINETVFIEDITAWKSSCTRIYFPNEDVLQPSFTASGNWTVCYACAITCHLPTQVTANRDPRLKFKCTCAQIPGKECLYSTRSISGIEAVAGKLKNMILEDLEKAKVEQGKVVQQQMSHQGVQQMANRLKGSHTHVLMYEQPELQALALSCIPIEVQQATGKQQVIDLLDWFKTSFFRWVDKPPCDQCGSPTKNAGVAPPTPEEQRWQANTVELYVCETCHTFTRFPRYNHPEKLLTTRRGRCGEWANTFTLCCRAIGKDARFILDFTDHVWTEVFEEESQRWVHCDPCENQYDKPMTYEAGWGKKLTYVFGFAWDHIIDVTKRYTRQWETLKTRRNMVDESSLSNIINKFNSDLSVSLPTSRREMIHKRISDEYVELENYQIVPASVQPDELQGRQSGSEEWRTQRGERTGEGGTCTVPVRHIEKPAPRPLPIHKKRIFNLDPTKVTLAGAAQFSGPNVHITQTYNGQKGGVYITDLLNVKKGFTVGFDFRIAARGADGLAFVVQRDPRGTKALGKEGNGLGYDGIAKSVAVELDTWMSGDCGDPSGNHVSVHTRGKEPNSSHHQHSLGSVNPGVVLNDGNVHYAFIQYDGENQTISVWIDKEPLLCVKIDIPTQLGLDDGMAWVGFVASTGGVNQLHELTRWSVNVPEN